MLMVFIFAVMLGTSNCGTIHENMRRTVVLLDDSSRIRPPGPTSDIEGRSNHENRTEAQPGTRHTSRKTIKSLQGEYKKKQCRTSNTVECKQLLSQLVQALAGTQKGSDFFRDGLIKIDFRYCLDVNVGIVHYNTDTQICCNGVFNKTSGHEECCKGEIIDNRQQFCCSEQVQNRTKFSKCCGRFTYDNRTHTCCHENLYSMVEGSSCCGNHVYDAKTEICCFGMKTFKRSQGDACCGTSVYNTLTHTCCENNIQPAYGKKNRKGECCNGMNFHLDCYKCDNDTVLPVFNEATGICCDGRVRFKKYGNSTGCCGRQVMDTGDERCLNKQITNKSITTQLASHNNVSEQTKTARIEIIDADGDNKPKSDRKIIIVIIISCASLVSACVVAVITVLCYKKKSCAGKAKSAYEADYMSVHTDNNQTEPTNDITQGMFYTPSIRANNDMEEKDEIIPENNCPDVQISINDDISNEHRSRLEESIITNIAKSNKIPNENVLTNHFKDTFTQTCPEKESNRRTILGQPFEHNFILGISNATAQMPNSDVKMTLPQSVLRYNQVEVNCTSFNTVSPLRKKLGLNDDERIASPVVEYALTGYGNLPDYAVVIIPFIGSPADLKVRKFQSDEGLNTVVKSTDVPLRGKMNEDIGVFYILKDSYVYIYTNSFSGFYCTTCRHRPLRLRSFLFGSYKRFTNPLRHEVRVMIYVADELMKFADYRERMFTNENAEGRVLKKEMLLRLPAVLKENDSIQFALTPTESHCGQWIHKLYPGDTNPIYDEIQTVELYHIAEKCKNCEFCHLPEHDIPHSVEWYMTNAEGIIPNYTFQCIVDVDVLNADGSMDETQASNRIVIDELQLRQEDRYPIEESFNARNVLGLKEYLSGGLLPEKKDKVLGSLASKFSCTGSSVEEVFFKLQEKLTPKYILEAVATVLKEKHMFEELDFLQHCGYLPRNLISTDIQPVHDGTIGSEAEIADNQNQVQANLHQAPVVNQKEANFPETNASGVESQASLHHFEDENAYIVTQNRRNKMMQENESRILVRNTSDKLLMNGEVVRPELSRRLSKSMGDIMLTGASPIPDVRGELDTRARESKSTLERQSLPVQEHASLDETDLKTFKKNDTD